MNTSTAAAAAPSNNTSLPAAVVRTVDVYPWEHVIELLTAFETRCFEHSQRYRRASMPVLSETGRAYAVRFDHGPQSEPVTVFHSATLPPVSLEHFARAICRRRFSCNAGTALLALALMVRFQETAELPVTAMMMHRLFCACVVAASKVHQDFFPSLLLVSRVVVMHAAELHMLEVTLYKALDWRMNITLGCVQRLHSKLIGAAPLPACMTTLRLSQRPSVSGFSSDASHLLTSGASDDTNSRWSIPIDRPPAEASYIAPPGDSSFATVADEKSEHYSDADGTAPSLLSLTC